MSRCNAGHRSSLLALKPRFELSKRGFSFQAFIHKPSSLLTAVGIFEEFIRNVLLLPK